MVGQCDVKHIMLSALNVSKYIITHCFILRKMQKAKTKHITPSE
jgi:hypothetical protein